MRKTIVHILLAFTLIAVTLFSGCSQDDLDKVLTGGEVITEEREFSDFSYLEISGAFDVDITQSDLFSVVISADESLFDLIEVSRQGDTLKIYLNPRHIFTDFTLGAKTLKAEITMPSLYGLEISGASTGTLNGFKSSDGFTLVVAGASSLNTGDIKIGITDIEVSGASRITGNMTADDADLEVSGASTLELSGTMDDIRLNVSGASRADLADLTVDDAEVRLSGASEATINVNGRLDSALSGASRLYFYGNPVMGDTDISGASTIKHK